MPVKPATRVVLAPTGVLKQGPMSLACRAALALLLCAPGAMAESAPTPAPTPASADDLSAAGIEGWMRSWVAEQRALLPQLDEDLREQDGRTREVREALIRIRTDAAAQKAVLALGDLRPADFARARRNWEAWRRVAESSLDRATAMAQALASRKDDHAERWALLQDESTADLLPGSGEAFQRAQGVQRRVASLLDRLSNLVALQVDDARTAIAVCDEVLQVLDRAFERMRSRFFVQRVDFMNWSAALEGLRKDAAAFTEPLAESRALDTGDRLLAALRQNAFALATGLILVAVLVLWIRRSASALENAADQLKEKRPTVLRRFAAALLVALSRTAILAVVAGVGFLLQVSLGVSSPAWLDALIALLRAFFVWRVIVAFLAVTLDPRSDRFRLLIRDPEAAELARQRLERTADLLFAGLFISTLVRYVGFVSPLVMLGFLAFQWFALRSLVRSLDEQRIARLRLSSGWSTAARYWRNGMRGAMVLVLGVAGLGFVNLAWYAAWALFNANVLALVALLLRGVAADALDEAFAGDAKTNRSLKRLVGLVLTLLSLVALPLVWGVGSKAAEWTRAAWAAGFDVGSTRLTVGSVLIALLWVSASLGVARLINALLTRRIFPYSVVDTGVREAITATTQYVFLAAGVLLAIRALGVDLTNLAIVAGALSVGVGFGMQTLVSNFVSGLIILFERPFRPGDILEYEGVMGSVRRIRTRSTVVQTFDEAELILPNADLLSKKITNWTLSNNRTRATVTIGVAYQSDLELVRDTLLEVAGAHPRLIDEPRVYLVAFGDNALEFRLMLWLDIREKLQVVSEVLFAIDKAFRERGIEIPYPQRVVRHVQISAGGAPPAGGSGPAAVE